LRQPLHLTHQLVEGSRDVDGRASSFLPCAMEHCLPFLLTRPQQTDRQYEIGHQPLAGA
jgi:hypothetical protein